MSRLQYFYFRVLAWFAYWPLAWDLAGAKIRGTRQQRRAILRQVLQDLWHQAQQEGW